MPKCPICGKALSLANKKTVCSDACKQKKYRMKRDYGAKALKSAQCLREMARVIADGGIEEHQMLITYNDIHSALRALCDAIDRAQEKQDATNK